ncbi:MAG: hypothetical protein CMJ75_18795 [Planctomycetaceae bacterium]|nr:hypothetical protein [Planctomycetaceae bacterium]
MRIAVANWPINSAGGITTWLKNFIGGARTLGHEVDHLMLSPQKRMKISRFEEHHNAQQGTTMKGEHVSYADGPGRAIQRLNGYDLVFFGHPGPHPTKANTGEKWEKYWLDIYAGVTARKVVSFHDQNWEKTNAWFAEARGMVDYVVAGQKTFQGPAERWADGTAPVDWYFHPMAEEEPPPMIPLEDRVRAGLLATQWISNKGHKKLVRQLDRVRVPLDMYGRGITYYYIRRDEPLWDAHVRDYFRDGEDADALDRETHPHAYYAHRPYEEIIEALRRARFAIDLSTNGTTNYTHWEPLWYGTPGFISEYTAGLSTNTIPVELVETFDPEDFGKALNGFVPSEKKVIEARKFVADRCRPSRVVGKILERSMA